MAQRIAFFGVGDAARPYLDVLGRRSDVNLVGVCDLDRRAAEQVAAGWGATVFPSFDTLLAEPLDALWICVAPSQQGEVIPRAVERRVPFFIVAPGALDYPRAVQFARAVQEAKLVTGVGFPTAYTDIVREAREYVGTNVVPLTLGWWLRPARDDNAPAATALLWNEACLLIDVLRTFCGEVKQIHAFAAGTTTEPDQHGGMVLHLAFVRGTIAVVTLATFPRPEPRVELELIGEGWTLTFESGLRSLRVVERDKTTILRGLNNPVEEQCATFLDAVKRNEPGVVPCGNLDALVTLHICHAARESARLGQPVAFTRAAETRDPGT